jgi:hypothetical protein
MISDTAIRNDAGQIAMKWMINPNGKTVRIGNTEKYYVFTPASHVVFAWVDEQDVEAILAVRQKSCNCNNGTYKQAFDYANLIDVNLVKCGNRNCE